MLEAQIPKDIRKYDAKFAGPFTLRQLICFIILVAIVMAGYKFLSGFGIEKNICLTIPIIIGSPLILIGWVKPYGIAFEKFIKTIFVTFVLAPRERKYVTNNIFSKIYDEMKPISKQDYQKRIKRDAKLSKDNPDFEFYK